MLEIREMTEYDIEQVGEIEESIFSMPWSGKSFQEALNKENTIYLVAESDGKILGYCGLWNIIGEGEITNVAVRSEYRRKKIARALLEQLLATGKEKGVEAFTLEVRESNTGAILLYESLGFVHEGIRKNFYEKPQENAIIMWKRQLD